MKNHWDTIAIIGVNLAIAGLLVALLISNNSQICATNARMNAANSRFESSIAASNARMNTLHVMFYDLLKDNKK